VQVDWRHSAAASWNAVFVQTHSRSVALAHPAVLAASVTQVKMQGVIPEVLVGTAAESVGDVVSCAFTKKAKVENAKASRVLKSIF